MAIIQLSERSSSKSEVLLIMLNYSKDTVIHRALLLSLCVELLNL